MKILSEISFWIIALLSLWTLFMVFTVLRTLLKMDKAQVLKEKKGNKEKTVSTV